MKYLAAVLLFVSSIALCQQEKKPKLHTFLETMKIMEDSKIKYEISAAYDTAAVRKAPIVLSNKYFQKKKDNGFTLVEVKTTPEADSIYTLAEAAFHNNEYEKAIALYYRVYAMDPQYTEALTYVGDSYFRAGQYDSAIAVFRRVIDQNFIDYDAHWFLADAYAKSGEGVRSIEELTIAHVLNVNHADLKKVLKIGRQATERAWDEWDFTPQYELSDSAGAVKVNCTPGWLGYAMVKAAWKYEPGYAESVDGEKKENSLVNWSEEKEAVMATLADSTRRERLEKIIKAGYFSEFVLYELTAKKYPQVMLSLPREEFDRIVEYVDMFH